MLRRASLSLKKYWANENAPNIARVKMISTLNTDQDTDEHDVEGEEQEHREPHPST